MIPAATARRPLAPEEESDRILQWIREHSSLAVGGLVLFIVLALLTAVRPAALGGNLNLVFVVGQSMEPTMSNGDLAVTLEKSSYKVGDVIAYRVASQGGKDPALVIHRIVGGNAEEGYVTQGDNRDYRDLWRPTPDQVVGRSALTIPMGAAVLGFVATPYGLALLAAFVAFVFLYGSRRKVDEGEEEVVAEEEPAGAAAWALLAVGWPIAAPAWPPHIPAAPLPRSPVTAVPPHAPVVDLATMAATLRRAGQQAPISAVPAAAAAATTPPTPPTHHTAPPVQPATTPAPQPAPAPTTPSATPPPTPPTQPTAPPAPHAQPAPTPTTPAATEPTPVTTPEPPLLIPRVAAATLMVCLVACIGFAVGELQLPSFGLGTAKGAVDLAVSKPAAATVPPRSSRDETRKPDFVVPDAPGEPAGEMSLTARAEMVARRLDGREPTSRLVRWWLYQHEWIVEGARFGWHRGAEALRVLVAVDRRLQRRWGIGARNEAIARAALAEVRAARAASRDG